MSYTACPSTHSLHIHSFDSVYSSQPHSLSHIPTPANLSTVVHSHIHCGSQPHSLWLTATFTGSQPHSYSILHEHHGSQPHSCGYSILPKHCSRQVFKRKQDMYASEIMTYLIRFHTPTRLLTLAQAQKRCMRSDIPHM